MLVIASFRPMLYFHTIFFCLPFSAQRAVFSGGRWFAGPLAHLLVPVHVPIVLDPPLQENAEGGVVDQLLIITVS